MATTNQPEKRYKMTKKELKQYNEDLKWEQGYRAQQAEAVAIQEAQAAEVLAELKEKHEEAAKKFSARIDSIVEDKSYGIHESLLPEKLGRFHAEAHEQAEKEMPVSYQSWQVLAENGIVI